jgi:hypothetical protein
VRAGRRADHGVAGILSDIVNRPDADKHAVPARIDRVCGHADVRRPAEEAFSLLREDARRAGECSARPPRPAGPLSASREGTAPPARSRAGGSVAPGAYQHVGDEKHAQVDGMEAWVSGRPTHLHSQQAARRRGDISQVAKPRIKEAEHRPILTAGSERQDPFPAPRSARAPAGLRVGEARPGRHRPPHRSPGRCAALPA